MAVRLKKLIKYLANVRAALIIKLRGKSGRWAAKNAFIN